MVKKRDNQTDDDERDYMAKAKDGEIGKFDGKDWLDAAGDTSSLLPGAAGDLAAAPLKALSGSIGAERDYKKYSKKLGRDLSAEATGNNRALKRQVDEMDGRAGANFERGSAIGGGAMAGQAIGSIAIPIPVLGTVAGAWIGSSIAGNIYDEVVKTQDQDAVGLVTQLREMQQRKQPIQSELVFAALASNLPDNTEKRLEDRLESLTGTRKFADALEQGKTGALTRLMQEFDADIRTDTHMPVDLNAPRKTTSEQYAELINSGQMDARALLFRNDMPSMQELIAKQNQPQSQPSAAAPQQNPARQPQPTHASPAGRMAMVNSELSGIAAGMNKMGVTPALDENGNLVLLPHNNKQTPGKA